MSGRETNVELLAQHLVGLVFITVMNSGAGGLDPPHLSEAFPDLPLTSLRGATAWLLAAGPSLPAVPSFYLLTSEGITEFPCEP